MRFGRCLTEDTPVSQLAAHKARERYDQSFHLPILNSWHEWSATCSRLGHSEVAFRCWSPARSQLTRFKLEAFDDLAAARLSPGTLLDCLAEFKTDKRLLHDVTPKFQKSVAQAVKAVRERRKLKSGSSCGWGRLCWHHSRGLCRSTAALGHTT